MTPLSLIHNDFSIRVRRFNGYSRTGRVKYTGRRNITPHQLAKLFTLDKVHWWYEKALHCNGSFSATKKDHYRIDFYRRYRSRC